jgi:hypothetical protein
MSPEARYGLSVFLLSAIWKTSLFAFGARDTFLGEFSILFVMLFMLVGIYMGVEEVRKSIRDKKILFIQGFKSGMSIAALHTILYSLFIYAYYAYIDSTFFPEMIELRVQEFRIAGDNEASIEGFRQSAELILSPMVQSTFTLVGLLVLSAFYAGVVAKMVEKKHGKPA